MLAVRGSLSEGRGRSIPLPPGSAHRRRCRLLEMSSYRANTQQAPGGIARQHALMAAESRPHEHAGG